MSERLTQISDIISELTALKDRVVIAIDGPCGSGKTTLAKRLEEELPSCAVVHTDDFFLQHHQRTEERLQEPGGNMDRERLIDEVFINAQSAKELVYHKYNCQTGELSGQSIGSERILIVEGSYSQHPDLLPYYDLTIYLDVDPEEQLTRLKQRVGGERLQRFITEWIPLENRYFTAFEVQEKADLRIDSRDLAK